MVDTYFSSASCAGHVLILEAMTVYSHATEVKNRINFTQVIEVCISKYGWLPRPPFSCISVSPGLYITEGKGLAVSPLTFTWSNYSSGPFCMIDTDCCCF